MYGGPMVMGPGVFVGPGPMAMGVYGNPFVFGNPYLFNPGVQAAATVIELLQYEAQK